MRVGFIGLGNMGRHMASKVAGGGHELTVFDVRRSAADDHVAAGAAWADSPSAVAEAADVVFTSLPRSVDVEEVATGEGGILSGAALGTAYFDLGTTDPGTISRIAEAAGSRGVAVLDAPVSGGTVGAEAGKLSVMVGGDREAFNKYKPVLDLIGDKVMYCGPVGSAAICKIVNNLVSLSVVALLAEAFTLGLKAGVELETLYEAISNSSGNTQRMHRFPDGVFKGNFEPGFHVDLAVKDAGLATQMAQDAGIPMELWDLVEQRYIQAQARGWGRLDSSAVVRLQEERAGVEIRG